MESNIKLLNKIKNESEDIYVLSSMLLSKLNDYTNITDEDDLVIKDIQRCLNDMFNAKNLLVKDFNNLKRKTKGS